MSQSNRAFSVPSLFVLALLGITLGVASCTLINEVDRTQIPDDASGGTSAQAGDSNGDPDGGQAGDSMGGENQGGTNNK